jgi:hypothetical protein
VDLNANSKKKKRVKPRIRLLPPSFSVLAGRFALDTTTCQPKLAATLQKPGKKQPWGGSAVVELGVSGRSGLCQDETFVFLPLLPFQKTGLILYFHARHQTL